MLMILSSKYGMPSEKQIEKKWQQENGCAFLITGIIYYGQLKGIQLHLHV